MSRMTHREYLIWLRRLDNLWNEPSRSDFYLMQMTSYLSKSYNPDRHRLRWGAPKGPPPMSEEAQKARIEQIKAAAIKRVGGKVNVRPPRRPDDAQH